MGDERVGQEITTRQQTHHHLLIPLIIIIVGIAVLEVISKQLPAVVNHVVPLPVGRNWGGHLQ